MLISVANIDAAKYSLSEAKTTLLTLDLVNLGRASLYYILELEKSTVAILKENGVTVSTNAAIKMDELFK